MFGLQDEGGAAVEVVAAMGEWAGACGDFEGELEGVAVGVFIGWARDFEEVAEGGERALGIRGFGRFGFGTVVDEGFYRLHGAVGILMRTNIANAC